MAHPFFDEHIKDFGPRTPEAEKPAEQEAYWGDIDSDEYTTLDSTARLACRRWILEDLVALHQDAPVESDDDEEDVGSYTATEEETDVDDDQHSQHAHRTVNVSDKATGAGKVNRRAATTTSLGATLAHTRRGEDEEKKEQAATGFWSWLNYIVS